MHKQPICLLHEQLYELKSWLPFAKQATQNWRKIGPQRLSHHQKPKNSSSLLAIDMLHEQVLQVEVKEGSAHLAKMFIDRPHLTQIYPQKIKDERL